MVDGSSYDIRVNRDANILVLICMVLALNSVNGDGKGNTNFGIGRIGPEDRPFDVMASHR